MGCRDQESNFQEEHFNEDDQKWWCRWGETSWEGPDIELVKLFPDFAEPTFESGGVAYSVERRDRERAIVKPLGAVAISE